MNSNELYTLVQCKDLFSPILIHNHLHSNIYIYAITTKYRYTNHPKVTRSCSHVFDVKRGSYPNSEAQKNAKMAPPIVYLIQELVPLALRFMALLPLVPSAIGLGIWILSHLCVGGLLLGLQLHISCLALSASSILKCHPLHLRNISCFFRKRV